MIPDIAAAISKDLERQGYWTTLESTLPGVQALLYARSPRPVRLGFARVEDHFLFVDWGNDAFGRLDRLREIYRRFSAFVNQGFRVPHVLRMTIPNLALVALGETEFPAEAVTFASTRDLNPFSGGETGQILLVDCPARQVIARDMKQAHHERVRGRLPLGHAIEVLYGTFQRCL